MTSTSPSSLAASWAPLLAASKKPLPSDFTTRPILTGSALAAVANIATESAAVTISFFRMLIEFPPFERCIPGIPISTAGLRLQRRFLSWRRRLARHDQCDACGLQHLGLAILDALVGDDGCNPRQAAQDEARAQAEFRGVDQHDELIGLVDQLLF